MRMLSHSNYIFSSSDLVRPPMWFLERDLLENGISVSKTPVFHARAYPRGHITSNGPCSLCLLVRLLETCLFISDCWRRSGTTSGAMRTAMPRTIVVTSSMYMIIVLATDISGVVGISLPTRILRQHDVRSEDSARPCLY